MLDGEKLGIEIWRELEKGNTTNPEELWKRIGIIIVDHFKNNAEVKSQVTTTGGNGTGEGNIL